MKTYANFKIVQKLLSFAFILVFYISCYGRKGAEAYSILQKDIEPRSGRISSAAMDWLKLQQAIFKGVTNTSLGMAYGKRPNSPTKRSSVSSAITSRITLNAVEKPITPIPLSTSQLPNKITENVTINYQIVPTTQSLSSISNAPDNVDTTEAANASIDDSSIEVQPTYSPLDFIEEYTLSIDKKEITDINISETRPISSFTGNMEETTINVIPTDVIETMMSNEFEDDSTNELQDSFTFNHTIYENNDMKLQNVTDETSSSDNEIPLKLNEKKIKYPSRSANNIENKSSKSNTELKEKTRLENKSLFQNMNSYDINHDNHGLYGDMQSHVNFPQNLRNANKPKYAIPPQVRYPFFNISNPALWNKNFIRDRIPSHLFNRIRRTSIPTVSSWQTTTEPTKIFPPSFSPNPMPFFNKNWARIRQKIPNSMTQRTGSLPLEETITPDGQPWWVTHDPYEKDKEQDSGLEYLTSDDMKWLKNNFHLIGDLINNQQMQTSTVDIDIAADKISQQTPLQTSKNMIQRKNQNPFMNQNKFRNNNVLESNNKTPQQSFKRETPNEQVNQFSSRYQNSFYPNFNFNENNILYPPPFLRNDNTSNLLDQNFLENFQGVPILFYPEYEDTLDGSNSSLIGLGSLTGQPSNMEQLYPSFAFGQGQTQNQSQSVVNTVHSHQNVIIQLANGTNITGVYFSGSNTNGPNTNEGNDKTDVQGMNFGVVSQPNGFTGTGNNGGGDGFSGSADLNIDGSIFTNIDGTGFNGPGGTNTGGGTSGNTGDGTSNALSGSNTNGVTLINGGSGTNNGGSGINSGTGFNSGSNTSGPGFNSGSNTSGSGFNSESNTSGSGFNSGTSTSGSGFNSGSNTSGSGFNSGSNTIGTGINSGTGNDGGANSGDGAQNDLNSGNQQQINGGNVKPIAGIDFNITTRPISSPISPDQLDTAVYTCNNAGSKRISNFINPSYPYKDAANRICLFRLHIQPGVCQVRVDLVETLFSPPTNGVCVRQYLTIQGTIWNPGIQRICGTNTDNHFYLEIDEESTSPYIEIAVSSLTSQSYKWGIWLAQIDCNQRSDYQAPKGCFQYYPWLKGEIKSFSFEDNQYYSDQHYRICIGATKNTCSVTFESKPGDFMLEKYGSIEEVPFDRSGMSSLYCVRDYLRIPDGSPDGGLHSSSHDRYCGGHLASSHGSAAPSPVTSRITGRIVIVEFHAGIPMTFESRAHGPGFKISYHQNLCPTNPDVLVENSNKRDNIPTPTYLKGIISQANNRQAGYPRTEDTSTFFYYNKSGSMDMKNNDQILRRPVHHFKFSRKHDEIDNTTFSPTEAASSSDRTNYSKRSSVTSSSIQQDSTAQNNIPYSMRPSWFNVPSWILEESRIAPRHPERNENNKFGHNSSWAFSAPMRHSQYLINLKPTDFMGYNTDLT